MLDFYGKTLVVVDMEWGYRKAMTEGVVENVERLIREAVRCDSLIIFLEFLDRGTLPSLLRLVRRYDGFARVPKQQANGAPEVIQTCRSWRVDPDAFVICGVDAFCCVAATAYGLADELTESETEVVQEACGSVYSQRWSTFPRRRNLVLIDINGQQRLKDRQPSKTYRQVATAG